MAENREIKIRNRMIMLLFRAGVIRKQIPSRIVWQPRLTYDLVKKVIQSLDRRRFSRGPDRRKNLRS